jgi:hypothetical protein
MVIFLVVQTLLRLGIAAFAKGILVEYTVFIYSYLIDDFPPHSTLNAMSDAIIPIHAIKGRGTATRIAHRFEKDVRAAWDDGWGTLEDAAGEALRPETQLPLRTRAAPSAATTRRTSISITRSIPTAVASMAVSTAMRGRRTAT